MEKERYYNILLNEWQKKFGNDRHEAVEFLKKVSINLSWIRLLYCYVIFLKEWYEYWGLSISNKKIGIKKRLNIFIMDTILIVFICFFFRLFSIYSLFIISWMK